MEQQAFFTELADILEVDSGAVIPEVELESLGWSSLAVISFIAFADEKFSVLVQPRKLAQCKTVSDLVQLLGENVSA
jgi:acyl carrier protein